MKRPKGARASLQRAVVPRPARILQTQDLDASLGYCLRRAQISTFAEFSSAMERYHVRPSQYAVLVLIRANPGMSQASACACLNIQKANFVTLLNRLEERGWTERGKADRDRRASVLRLTPQGQVLVRKLETAHARMEEKLAGRLGDRRTRTLLRLLQAFCAAESRIH